MATTVTHYVDPNAAAGGNGTTNALSGTNCAYTSLSAWEAAQQRNLVTADEVERVICSSNDDDPEAAHAADTTGVTIDGWTVDATRYIQVEAASNHGGKWNDKIYRREAGFTSSKNIVVIGLQGHITASLNSQYVFRANPEDSGFTTFYKCIGKFSLSGSASTCIVFACVWRASGNTTINFINCIAYDAISDTGTGNVGFGINRNNTAYLYNCTSHNCLIGFLRNDGTAIAKNCGAANCTAGFQGTISQTTCSSNTPAFVDEANDNFHLTPNDTTWKDKGTDLSEDANFPFADDIDGDMRAAPWDIGADEYVSSGQGGTATPSGVASSSAVGSVTPSAGATATPAGVQISLASGTTTPSAGATVAPTGVSATAALGIATAQGTITAEGTAFPAGVAATASLGTIVPRGGATVLPPGVSAQSQHGLAVAAAGALATVGGLSMQASVGDVSVSIGATATPQGVSATSAVGSVIAQGAGEGEVFVSGVAAQALVGTPTVSTGATVYVVGLIAQALVGNVLAGDQPVAHLAREPWVVTSRGMERVIISKQ